MRKKVGVAPRTLVTFRCTKFNTSETRRDYINPNNYGDDVAEWLRNELAAQGIVVGRKIGQEDFGWWLSFQNGGRMYDFVLGYNADGYWMGWLERERGMAGSLFGMRRKGIQAEAAKVIHSVLVSTDFISDIRWHTPKDFDSLREDMGKATPV
jgi:hypothetical protein